MTSLVGHLREGKHLFILVGDDKSFVQALAEPHKAAGVILGIVDPAPAAPAPCALTHQALHQLADLGG